MTYLIIRLATLGNVAMTVPVVASLSRRYPNDRFVVASKKDLGAMFAAMPNVRFWEVDNHLSWKGVWALWRALRDQVDEVIDLQDVPRTRVLRTLLWLSGKKVTSVRYGRFRKHLITLFGFGRKPLPTEFERYADTFRRAGLETDTEFTALPMNEAAAKTIEERYGEKKGRWIGLAPFAKSRSNMLPYRVTKDIIELNRVRDVKAMGECLSPHRERCRKTESERGAGADAEAGCDDLHGQREPTPVEFSGIKGYQCLVRDRPTNRICGMETETGRHHPTP